MRIVLIGQAAFGEKVLEALLKKGEEVAAVFAKPDKNGKADPLKLQALKNNLPINTPVTYKDDSVFDIYCSYKPDLAVMAFVTDIIPTRFFEASSKGAICYHPSILPRHRGGSAINWAIIMGDTKTGLTIFQPDGGIDTGPVIIQKEIEIGPNDTTGSIYFNHLFPMGVDAILESVDIIKTGLSTSITQDEAEATYEPLCNDKIALLDWNKSTREIHNFIRGCDPQPGAFSFIKGEKVRFYGSIISEINTEEPSGTILSVGKNGMTVSAGGSAILIAKISSSLGKMDSDEFCSRLEIRPGDHFSS